MKLNRVPFYFFSDMSCVEGLLFFIFSVHITRPASLVTLISLPCQWPAKNSNCSSHLCTLFRHLNVGVVGANQSWSLGLFCVLLVPI